MDNLEVLTAINKLVDSFKGVDSDYIQRYNEGGFSPPLKKIWCRVTIQYSPTVVSGIHFGRLERDYGIVSIQCFAPKGTNDFELTRIAGLWRNYFKGYSKDGLTVDLTHAPTPIDNELSTNYVSTLVRIDFHVN